MKVCGMIEKSGTLIDSAAAKANGIGRRAFLASASTFAAACGAKPVYAAPSPGKMPVVPQGKPNLKVGIMSDTHVHDAGQKEKLDLIRKVLRFFDDQKVDAVMVAGDLADTGLHQLLSCLCIHPIRQFY